MGQEIDFETFVQGIEGSVLITTKARGLVLTVVRGTFTADMDQAFLNALEAEIARASTIVVFNDWEAMTGFDRSVRVSLVKWSIAHRREIESLHVLVRSRAVAFGVATAAAAVRASHVDLRPYEDRAEFGAAFAAELRRRTASA